MSNLPEDDAEARINARRIGSGAVSEAIEERVNDHPARLGEAVKAVHVAQRCGTDRRPACHIPLPAGRSYHVNTTVHYDSRRVAKPGVVSVTALMILPPRRDRQSARTTLDFVYEAGQDIPRDVVQGHDRFDSPSPVDSSSDGAFARYRWKSVTGPHRGW